jgi:outer membrane protein assembly factor BamE (lipoprotein component of BamABCDE complex)
MGDFILSKLKISLLSSICALFIFTGCENIQGPTVPESKLTVGKVQQNIQKGMFSTDVIKALGSPNIITKDKSGKTTWAYDKVSTYHSKTNGGLNFVRMNENDFVITAGVLGTAGAVAAGIAEKSFLLGVGGTVAALGLITYASTSDDYEYKTEQKTLTIILNFDENERLQNFSYMYSSF